MKTAESLPQIYQWKVSQYVKIIEKGEVITYAAVGPFIKPMLAR